MIKVYICPKCESTKLVTENMFFKPYEACPVCGSKIDRSMDHNTWMRLNNEQKEVFMSKVILNYLLKQLDNDFIDNILDSQNDGSKNDLLKQDYQKAEKYLNDELLNKDPDFKALSDEFKAKYNKYIQSSKK